MTSCRRSIAHSTFCNWPGSAARSWEGIFVRVSKPVVLALTSYFPALWDVKVANGARLKAVIVGGWFEQEIEGVPAGVPVVYRAANPAGRKDYFYGGYKGNALEYRPGADRLNDPTGLPVATFPGR